MRKDSPLAACSIAASILLLAGAVLVPSSAWQTVSVLARLTPSLVSTAGEHGMTAARAARLGIRAAPGLLQDSASPAEERRPQVRVCRREVQRSCQKTECPRQLFQRLRLVFPING